jgi:hypothetical protein
MCAVPMPLAAVPMPLYAGALQVVPAHPMHTSSGLGPALAHLGSLLDHAGAATPYICPYGVRPTPTGCGRQRRPALITALVQCRCMCRSRTSRIVSQRAVKNDPALTSDRPLHEQCRPAAEVWGGQPHAGPALAGLGAAPRALGRQKSGICTTLLAFSDAHE